MTSVMTQEDQARIIGKTHIERNQNRDKMRALLQDASNIGSELEKAGKILQNQPWLLGFDNEEYFPANPQFDEKLKHEYFDGQRLLRLLQDIRSTRQAIKQANQTLGDPGDK